MPRDARIAVQFMLNYTAALRELGHEITCHGWRWVHCLPENVEREQLTLRP